MCELVDALEISQSTLSGHLQVLRQTGLVITRKEGRWISYSLTDQKMALIEALFSRFNPMVMPTLACAERPANRATLGPA